MLFAALLFCLSGSISENAVAATPSYPKRLHLDLYYAPTFYSTRAISSFGQDVLDGESTLFDWLGDKIGFDSNFIFRTLWSVSWVYFPNFSGYLTGPLHLTIHEYGHGTRVAAAGGRPYFGYFGGSGTHYHFLTYFLLAYVNGWSGGYTGSSGSSFSPSIYPSYWGSVTSMGGVNTSSLFAESLADRAYYTGSHFLQGYNYVFFKLDAYTYANSTYRGSTGLPAGVTGDMTNAVNYYSSQGMGISLSDIWTGSMNSLLFSAGTYSYIWSLGKYIFTGDPTVHAFQLAGIRLPELSHYLTSEGLSYRVGSGIHSSDTYIPFSVEMIYKGRTAVEVTLGYRKYKNYSPSNPRGYFELGIVGNTLGGIGGHFKKEIDLDSSSLLDLGLTLHHYRTFLGERTTTGMMAGPFGIEAVLAYTKTY